MRITAIEVAMLNVDMHQAIKTPIGEIAAARNVVVKIMTADEVTGWGETSPMPAITGDSQQSCHAMGKEMAPLLLQANALSLDKNLALLQRFCPGATSIRCAFDMALYDLAAKYANMPLYQFLGGSPRELVTDHTIGNQDSVEQTVAMARKLVKQGFTAIKLKTGRPRLADVAHVEAVRKDVGNEVAIRIDCNQGWDYPEAIANLAQMQRLGVEYVEQPLPAWDVDGFARLRKQTPIPICADESMFSHFDALRLVKQDAVDYLNIKLVKAGGIHTALKINGIAEAAGVACMIGCFGESRLGLSAAAHLAMAKPNIQFIDLDSAYHFSADPVVGGLEYAATTGGVITLPDTPGHGASLDETALENVFRAS